MAKDKRFVFNDGSKNSYGFIIPTDGISLKRFQANPVMLDSHYNSTHAVLGKWDDVKADKGVLTGIPVFDEDDEAVTKIAGKVDRGFIKSCSMGITFNRDDLKYVEGVLILEKCELYEVSIVAVPSNANSIRLYSSETGELLKDEEVQKLCLSAMPVHGEEIVNQNQNSNMKITLKPAVLLALGFAASTTEVEAAELEAKIEALNAAKNAAELKLTARIEAEEQAKLAAITAKVDASIKAGKGTAEKRDQYIQLGIANPDLLDDVFGSIPAKTSLAAQVEANGGTEVKTAEDFQKLSHEAQLQFKQTQPAEYQKLFTPKKQ